ncbi:serine/threonine protein kinase [Brasilonema octagenarum UFV-E1]|uniref:Serine/threonine protein kinase n=2 Tax=Brasilonema TaxID=383614 RepID=A0A856MPD5_9CYAN|nr:protein kinase [Brasilonema sennae]QDL12402.1 serine/threonine protein kinase [Brasilonema sennae CENA114]QDL18787.1 serine/threonine protein kinase [Brasilonema octagenarum UFV-E1]
MICCLNPACHNPPNPDGTMFCPNCGTGLVVLRNRYRPIKSLGSGGFGKTYLAEDVDKLKEKCVIKQLAPQVQGTGAFQKAKELFEQEAIRLQQLGDHPQIPTLLAYFEQDNRLYLVQQFIDGQDLSDELKQQGRFSEQQIRELLVDLLNILKIVHQHKVIHRDIKPGNIIRRSSDGKLVLIDFGASKQLTQTVMSGQGTTIGTFGYAPLEQMQGGEAYPASDLFSLGATCFHLLSGIQPRELFNKQGYGWVSSWRQHLQQSVSQQFGRILDKLLEEDYQQRYQSAGEVLQDLNPPPPPPAVPPTVQPPQPSPPPPSVPLTVQSPQPLPALPATSAKQKGKFKSSLLLGGAILLLGLVGTEIYGYFRYEVFPVNPIFLITSPPSSFFLKSTLTGHTDWVWSVAISPDGKTLVSASIDKTIKIWNLQTGELKSTLTGHTDSVNSVAISPDGKTLVSGSWDNTIKIWNLQTGELKSTLTGHTYWVVSVAISPDGKTLVSGSFDSTIKIWNLQTPELQSTLTGHTYSVYSVAISPDGKTLVSGSTDSTIKIWNLQTPELQSTLTGHTNVVTSVAISPDGKTLVSGSADKTIKIWRMP